VRMLLPSSLPACACVRVRVCTRDGMRKGKRGRRLTSGHQDIRTSRQAAYKHSVCARTAGRGPGGGTLAADRRREASRARDCSSEASHARTLFRV